MEPTIGIITALGHEYIAVRSMLDRFTDKRFPGRGAGRRYVLGEIDSLAGEPHRVVLHLAGKGTNIASRRATLMLEHFRSVQCILMVGIACGVPNPQKVATHVRLGDVVVSDRGGVLQYDFRKLEDGVEEIRGQWTRPSAELIEAFDLLSAEALVGHRPWEDSLRDSLKILKWKRPPARTDVLFDTFHPATQVIHPRDSDRRRGQPRVFAGPIGAANTLLKDARRRDQLRAKYGIRAFEMEGSGIADATWDHESGYMIIRGVCDYGDHAKADMWQRYAAVAAAAYAKALIKAVLANPIDKPPDRGAVDEPAAKLAATVRVPVGEPAAKLAATVRMPPTGGDLLDAACTSVPVPHDPGSVPAPAFSHPFIDLADNLRQSGCSLELVVNDGKLALRASPRFSVRGERCEWLPLSEIEGSQMIYQPHRARAVTLSWKGDSRKLTLQDDRGNTLLISVDEPNTP